MVNSAKKRPAVQAQEGDLVFARVRGYPAWPARVERVETKNKVHVFFFGTYETATVKQDDIWPYNEETKAKYGKQKKKKDFAKGMDEIENNPSLKTVEDILKLDAPAADGTSNEDAGDAGDIAPAEQPEDATPAATSSSPATESAEPAGVPEEAMEETQDETPKPSRGRRKSGITPSARGEQSTGTPRGLGRGVKRKAETTTPVATPPPAKQGKASADTPGTTTTSRSGRVIKQKKFDDEIIEQESAGAKAFPNKMYAKVKTTGDTIEIDLNKDRPEVFESKEKEINWEKATVKNARKFKEKIESGEYVPEEIREKLAAKTNRTEEEEQILKKQKQHGQRLEKIQWLRTEMRLVDLDVVIRKAIHFQRPNMSKCMEALNELNSLPLSPLMLKKQPDIVSTIRRLRKYVGPQAVEDANVGEDWGDKAEQIRLRAEQVFHKLRAGFTFPETCNFWLEFDKAVTDFREVTKDMDRNELMSLVQEPIAVNDSKQNEM